MIQSKISNDFFNKAILQGQVNLLNSFSPSVKEFNLGADFFFEIDEKSEQYKINDRIIRVVLDRIQINSSAYGFVPGRSYFDYLRPHISGYYFLRLDVKDFFHSISIEVVKNFLRGIFSNVKDGYSYSPYEIALSALTHKVSKSNKNKDLREKQILPKGFPSSPVISNVLFRKIDILIQKFCEDKGIVYTRYADDLLFSSYKSSFLHSEQFQKEISILIDLLSLRLKRKKRTVAENTISLNGYVIQNKRPIKGLSKYLEGRPVGSIRLSDKKLKLIKKIAYHIRCGSERRFIMEKYFNLDARKVAEKYGVPNPAFYDKYVNDQFQNKLKGYRSYLISIIKYDIKYSCVDKKCISKVKTLLKVFESSILQ